MTEDVERLKAIRGAHRGVVTKLTRQAEEIFENEFITSDHYERLFVIHQQLSTKLETLNDYDQRILTVCDEINIENEIEESQQTVEKVMERNRKIDVKLKQANPTTIKTKAIQIKRRLRDQHCRSSRFPNSEEMLRNGAHFGTVFSRRFTTTKTFQRSINSTISNQC